MKKLTAKTSATVLLLSSLAFAAQHVVIDKLEVIDNSLCITYHINELLNDKSVEALQRGIKSEVVHNIQLWRQKSFINPLEKQIDYRIKVSYDNWEKKFRLETAEENRLTPSLETVKAKCTFVENFPIAAMGELEREQKYHLSIDVTFQLISAESYNAISDIFAGEKKTAEPPKGKGGLLSVFVNLLGLGDKEFSLKTKDFTITSNDSVKFVP